jgi:hypothetical protein
MNEIPVLDLLTVISELEHCDPDRTIVTFWGGQPIPYSYRDAWEHLKRNSSPPKRRQLCLRCFCLAASTFTIGDGRAAVVEAIRRGAAQVEKFEPRPPLWPCPRCQAPLHERMRTQSELRRFPSRTYRPPPHLPKPKG